MQADLLVALGVRFDDRVTGKLEAFAARARIVHIGERGMGGGSNGGRGGRHRCGGGGRQWAPGSGSPFCRYKQIRLP